MKKIMSISIFFGLILCLQIGQIWQVKKAHADVVYCTNCSNNLLQNLMKAESLQQLQTMLKAYDETVNQTMQQVLMVKQNVEQYTTMIKNTARLPNDIVTAFAGELSKLAQITNELNTIRNDVVGLSKIHDEVYISQDVLDDLANAPSSALGGSTSTLHNYRDKWFERIDESTEATFKLTGQQLKDLEEAGELENHINELLATPDGQVKAIMASNQLASLQIYEARQLRELMLTRIQSDLASQMKKNKEEQYADALKQSLFNTEGLDFKPIPDPF